MLNKVASALGWTVETGNAIEKKWLGDYLDEHMIGIHLESLKPILNKIIKDQHKETGLPDFSLELSS